MIKYNGNDIYYAPYRNSKSAIPYKEFGMVETNLVMELYAKFGEIEFFKNFTVHENQLEFFLNMNKNKPKQYVEVTNPIQVTKTVVFNKPKKK